MARSSLRLGIVRAAQCDQSGIVHALNVVSFGITGYHFRNVAGWKYGSSSLVYAAAASIPDLERRIEQQENFISILLGNNPQAIARGRKLIDQPHALEVPAGLPSSLLERRPDIRQAEQQLIAANAQIGVAKADYFPQISLTAVGGYQSSALTSLFSGPAGLWTFGGNAVQPVFEGGRIRNRVRFACQHSRSYVVLPAYCAAGV
jgi:Outer membrane efflux protein